MASSGHSQASHVPAAQLQPAPTAVTLEAAPANEQMVAETAAPVVNVPKPVYVAPAPVRKPAAAPAKEKGGLSVGVIAGAAVAAVTLLAAGVSIAKSGGKKADKASQKAKSRPAASTKTASRTSSSRPASTRPASTSGTKSSTAPRSSSTAGRRSSSSSTGGSSSRPSSRTGARSSSSAGGAAAPAAAAAAAATTAAAAAPAPRKPAPSKPAAPAPAPAAAPAPTPAPAPAAAPVAAAAPAPAAAAAAAPTPAQPAVTEASAPAAAAPAAAPAAQKPEPQSPPAPPAAAAADSEPSAPATPAVDKAVAESAPSRPMLQEVAAAAADTAAPAAEKQPEQPAAAAAAPAEPAAEEPAAASEEPAAAAAAPPAAEVSDAAEAPAAAAAAADGEAAAAAAEGGEAAAEAAAEGANEEGDLIELAEGETLPVVDEEGNTLGTLHHDGRVVDAAGKVIGGLDEEGNVMLYEQAAEEEMIILSPAEEEAEQLMRQAAMAWNMQQNREGAVKMQKKALEAVTKEAGAARPEIVAEVASSLADMLYATNKMEGAKEALQVALDAAEAGDQHALYIKLSNNMGAVLRKQEQHTESKALHQKALQMALDKFGVAHATTTLARGNLVDALDQLGEREEARKLLNDNIDSIKQYTAQKEAEEEAPKAANGTAAAADGEAVDEDGKPVSNEMASMLAVDSKRAATAAIRAQIELARLEMKDKCFPRAIEVLEGALDTATAKFGQDTAEASSVMAALATCHRQAGDLETSAQLFNQLYDINEAQSEGGAANQSGVMLARTLADIYIEAEKDSDALKWAETSLELMQSVAELPRGHPALEPHINLVIELKQKTGDEAGAEELRKELLKGKAKLMAAMQRQSAAAGGRGAGGRGGAAAAAAAAGGARANGASKPGGKKGGRGKK